MSKAQTMLLVCLNFLFLQFAIAQCPTGDIILPNQAAIDNFPTDYPGCSVISGKLVIGLPTATSSDINDLSPLAALQSVAGLELMKTSMLVDLDGLHNLTTINGDLLINDNTLLNDLSQLMGVTSAIKSVSVLNNPALTNLVGLSNIVVDGGRFSVDNNAGLLNLKGAPQFSVLDELRITANAKLADILDIQNLTTAGMMKISGLPALTNLNGLSNLNIVHSSFEISDLPLLNTLSALSHLEKVNDMFTLAMLPSITNLNGLEALLKVGNLIVLDNAGLQNLDGLLKLNDVKSIQVASNPVLVDLTGMDAVTNLEYLFILNNQSLINLTGLENLIEIRQGLQIAGNASLASLLGINQLQRIGGVLAIVDNNELTSLVDIKDISLQGSLLYIADNDKLTTCHVDNVCEYVDLKPGQSIITNNDTGCLSVIEVHNSCALFALPVELVSFEATKRGSASVLTWTTANEYNNKGFEIMRSVDAEQWIKLDWMAAKTNGESANTYEFTDAHEINGDVYYRIYQVDLDNERKTSDVKSLKFGYKSSNLFVYPNPAISKVTIEYQSADDANNEVEIGLYDLTGKSRKFVRNDLATGQIDLDLQGLPHGYYTLIVNGSSSKLMIIGEAK